MHTELIKEKAIKLRTQDRLSLPEILKLVPVARSTLSLWLRAYPLTMGELKARRQVNSQRARDIRLRSVGERGPSGEWSTRPKLSKSDLGEACRQMICAKLLLQGMVVFRPLTEDTPVDLVILTPTGRFLKCQCKCIFRANGKTCHHMSFCSVRKWGPSNRAVKHTYTPDEVDVFLGYCVDNDSVYVIPYKDTRGRSYANLWVTSGPILDRYSEDSKKWCNAFNLLETP